LNRFIFKGIQQVSIKGLLYRDGKVLILRTPKRKYWELPGGRIDFAEKAEQAFKREMREEVGFKKVKLGKFLNIWSFTSKRNGVDYHFIILDFMIFTDETDIKLSAEHTEYKWVGIKDINKLKMRAGHKESIRKFFRDK
jgi:8-oxo-dGTP diphosphatase